MSDRFKFRVFDNTHKEYLPLSDCKLDARSGEIVKRSLFQENRYIIEQCTGLTDKNGKLIYEGDVVKTKDFGKDIDNRINVNDYDTFVVKFHECGFYIENDSRRFPMSCRPKLEIIGNIHEMEVEK
jgi:uncharacterized phage protein (TIGR01671 family)